MYKKFKDIDNKPLTIFLIIVLIIGLCGSSYFIYEIASIDKVEKQDEKHYKLDVYKYEDGRICGNRDHWCNTLAFSIETESENATFITSDYEDYSFILYNDNGLKIYNINTKESTKVDLESNYKNYSIYLNNEKNKIAGIIYTLEDNTVGYYNFLEHIKLYEGEYNNLYFLDENYISGNNDSKSVLLDASKEKIELSSLIVDNCGTYFSLESYNGKYYFFEKEGCNSDFITKIYNNTKQVIYDSKVQNHKISVVDGMLYLVDDKVVKKYDTSGNLLTTSRELENIFQLINNYVVYISNNNLVLYNIDSKNETIITKWINDYYYDYYTSGYYTRKQLDSMEETEKEEGLYLVINYKTQDSNGNYGIEYCYNQATKEIKTYEIKEEIGGRAKPVLYLYPTKTINIKVSFEHPEYLTTTYPKYNDGFDVKVSPNGDMYDKDGKYYYAIYWDEKRYNEVDFHEGFYVTDENAINFLEEKLTLIGLNDRERNEFIMYWLPILESNKQSLVYFELTEERERGNKLIIEPSPDSLLRVSIHIKKVNNYINIKEQKLETFKRVGFTAVEWGGMTYPLS